MEPGSNPGVRSSMETEELLRGAMQRAGHIRSELVQLREQAFVAACSGPFASATAAAASAKSSDNSSLQIMMLQQRGGQQLKGMPQLPAVALGTPAHGMQLSGDDAAFRSRPALLGAEGHSPGLASGECRAAPKSSGGNPMRHSIESWSIPCARQQQQQQPLAAPWRLASAADSLPPALQAPGASSTFAPSGAVHPAEAMGPPSFEDLIAALRAEAVLPPESELGTAGEALAAALHGNFPGQHSWANTTAVFSDGIGPSSGSWSQWRSGVAHSQQQLRRPASRAGRQQQAQPPLPTFDPTEVERQLKEKLSQVNAAKRYNDVRMRSGSTPAATPRASALPRMPLASLGRAGSATGSVQGSARYSGQENLQGGRRHGKAATSAQQVHQQGASPLRPGSRRTGDSSAYGNAAIAGEASPPNFLPLARDEHSPLHSRAAVAAAAAADNGSLKLSLRESKVSLVELLSAPPHTGLAAAPTHSRSISLRHSAFSVSEAASTAPAAAVTIQPAAQHQHNGIMPQVGTSLHCWDAEAEAEPPSHYEFIPLRPLSAGAQAAAAGPAAAASQRSDVVPSEAPPPPLQDTPRDGSFTECTPRGAAPSSAGKQRTASGGLVGCTFSRLTSPFMSKLQSPPATPLYAGDAGAAEGRAEAAVRVATAAIIVSASSRHASTASSVSPEVQQQQQQGSPLRSFPRLSGQDTPRQLGDPGQQQQQPRQQPQSSQSIGASSNAGGSFRQLTVACSSSIGRKRSGSEVGLSGEEPASLKKRSPEVVSGGHRLLSRTARLPNGDATAVGALITDAAGPAARVNLLEAGLQGTMVELFADEFEQQRPRQQQNVPAPSTLLPSAVPALAAAAYPPGSRLVMPVVLQHSPMKHRRQPQQQLKQPQPSIPTDSTRPAAAAVPSNGNTVGPQQQGEAHAAAALHKHRPPRPIIKHAAPAAALPTRHQTKQQQEEQQPKPLLRKLQCAAAAAVSSVAMVGAKDEELPSESCWVASPHEAQQQQPAEQQPELTSTSVLVGGRPHANGGAASAESAATHLRQRPQQQAAEEGAGVSVVPLLPTAQAVQSAAAVPASPVRTATATAALPLRGVAVATITLRRRLASLEPPEAGLCLLDDTHGKELLGCAPELAGMTGIALLDIMRQGCIVRKSWVKPNFKRGGSSRCIQLAPGAGGRVECLYPHGLFRKPLCFVVKRAVVNLPAWRLGVYLVLDTARGMLRLEPASAAEYARWVLALNAAFQTCSGAALGLVRDMCWSPAILFG